MRLRPPLEAVRTRLTVRIHSPAIIYFDAVRRAGSIREAARQLNVASSAVNRQILRLEAEVGAALFDRFAGGVKLTSAGEAMARHVLVVLQDLERAQSDILGLKGARAGHVGIAAVEGVLSSLLPAAMSTLRARSPRILITAEPMGSLTISQAIADGLADVGIAFALRRRAEVRQVIVGRFKLGAIMAPQRPLARRAALSVSECFAYPVIMPSGDLSIGRLLQPALERLALNVQPIIRSSSIEFMRELAMRDIGLSFQTRIGIERQIADGRLIHVPLEANGPIWSDLGVYVRSGRALPSALDLFLQILGEELRRRQDAEETGQGA